MTSSSTLPLKNRTISIALLFAITFSVLFSTHAIATTKKVVHAKTRHTHPVHSTARAKSHVKTTHKSKSTQTATQAIPTSALAGFDGYPNGVKQLISNSLQLSEKKLSYIYGSANPNNRGMDCSGTIHYLLSKLGYQDIPRQANEMYVWLETEGKLHYVDENNLHSWEFDELKPGNLLFWTGTYKTNRNPPITHVMLYLGRDKENRPLMFGASKGRSLEGRKLNGVSVFDFQLPSANSKARFVAYGCIPSLTC